MVKVKHVVRVDGVWTGATAEIISDQTNKVNTPKFNSGLFVVEKSSGVYV